MEENPYEVPPEPCNCNFSREYSNGCPSKGIEKLQKRYNYYNTAKKIEMWQNEE
jgi:hypothetical protein